jgi:hypothetical protein
VAKLATARQAVAAASEALEGFGGAGYVEDTGLPVLLRDAQVLPIWEGTTNVLSLDVLRAVAREDALRPWAEDVGARLDRLRDGPLGDTAAALAAYLGHARAWFAATSEHGPQPLEAGARRFAFAVAAVASGVGLCEQGSWALARGRSERSALAARAWAAARLVPLPDPALARYHAAARHVLSGLDD